MCHGSTEHARATHFGGMQLRILAMKTYVIERRNEKKTTQPIFIALIPAHINVFRQRQ
jgi:hypothetical protein